MSHTTFRFRSTAAALALGSPLVALAFGIRHSAS